MSNVEILKGLIRNIRMCIFRQHTSGVLYESIHR